MDTDPQLKITNLLETIKGCTPLYFKIDGPIPSKKNQKQIVYVRGRPLIISSNRHKEWHKQAFQNLKNAPRIDGNVEVSICIIYGKDKRKWDLGNKWESVADLLVDTGKIADDNYSVLNNIILIYGGIDKENPRAEVYLYTKTSVCQL